MLAETPPCTSSSILYFLTYLLLERRHSHVWGDFNRDATGRRGVFNRNCQAANARQRGLYSSLLLRYYSSADINNMYFNIHVVLRKTLRNTTCVLKLKRHFIVSRRLSSGRRLLHVLPKLQNTNAANLKKKKKI